MRRDTCIICIHFERIPRLEKVRVKCMYTNLRFCEKEGHVFGPCK